MRLIINVTLNIMSLFQYTARNTVIYQNRIKLLSSFHWDCTVLYDYMHGRVGDKRTNNLHKRYLKIRFTKSFTNQHPNAMVLRE